MEGDDKLYNKTSFHDNQEDFTTNTPQNVADSPFSGDEAAETIVPPLKKRKGAHKRVVTVPIGGGDGSPRTRGEVYPPPDTWSWRKYGQKPIKGSPYPRGYYRCSSSKGCPARKQVERNRLDPTMLLITYSHDHNHPLTATNKHHHRNTLTTTTTTSSTTNSTSSTTTTDTTDNAPAKPPPEELAIFTNQSNVDPGDNSFPELSIDFGWFSDVGSTTMVESTSFVVPKWGEADIAVMLPIGEEDQSLFGDLGELPECSMVFRHPGSGKTPCYGGTG